MGSGQFESYSCFISACFNNYQSKAIFSTWVPRHFHSRLPVSALQRSSLSPVMVCRGAEVTRVSRGGRRPGVTHIINGQGSPVHRSRSGIASTQIKARDRQAVIRWWTHPCNPIVKVIITFHVFTQFYRYIEDLCCLVNILDTGHI